MNTQRTLLSVLGFLASLSLLSGCTPQTTPAPTKAEGGTSAPPPSASPGLFADVTKQAGIDYQWVVEGKRPFTILQTIGNGAAFLDYNGDGNLDILLVGPKIALYRGDGKGHFTDVTKETGLDTLKGHFLGCATGDYDNDGFTDLYLSAYRGGTLLHNEGGKSFRDVTTAAGIPSQPWATSCSFVDIDNDGKLDLYIGNYAVFGPDTMQLCDHGGIKSSCGPRQYATLDGVLFHNEGNGKFRDVTKAWQLTGKNKPNGRALGVAAADFDGSGKQSIAIANDEMNGDLLHNVGGKFKNIGPESAVATDSDGNVHGGMGLDWGDYDNDGKLDLVVATFQHEAKCVYHNEGDRLFLERSAALGIASKTVPFVAFGTKFFDFDNDGWLDILFANGHVQDNIEQIEKAKYRQLPQLFRNKEGKGFEEVSAQGGSGFQKPIVGRGLAVGDYDNDGKEDVLFVDSEGSPLLLHNETPNAGHWLSLNLVGTKSNREGIGALVTMDTGERKLLRRCATDGSYLSASDKRVHFGLGKATSIVSITVHWPDGHRDLYKNIKIDALITLKEGGKAPLP